MNGNKEQSQWRQAISGNVFAFATLPASLMFGVFWAKFGPRPAFFIGALLAVAAILILWIQKVTTKVGTAQAQF